MSHKKPKRSHRAISFSLFVALLWSLPACIITTEDDDGELSVLNDSSFIIEELRVASVGSRFYGPDLLAGSALFPGESITVRLDCDFYDVLFVDSLNLECEVIDVDVCFDRTVFIINDALLSSCAFYRSSTLAPLGDPLGFEVGNASTLARETSP